jgi:glutaredoxin
MTNELLLYTRKECCLCEEMKEILRQCATRHPLTITEIDVDRSAELQQKYGDEVPVLFINGRKAFKYRLTARELERRLKR